MCELNMKTKSLLLEIVEDLRILDPHTLLDE